MNVRLDALQFDLGNPFIKSNDVHVHFEYERLEDNDVKLFMSSYVGNETDTYRFHIKLVYIVHFDTYIEDDERLVQETIDSILPSFTELIVILDSVVKEEKERH